MPTWTEEQYAEHLIKHSVRVVGQKDGEATWENTPGLENAPETGKEAAVSDIGANPRSQPVKAGSQLEQDFFRLLAVNGLPEPEREAILIPGRKFRADGWYARAGIAIECEGGVFGGKSGHNTGLAIERDCEKARFYSLHGIRLYRVTRKSLTEKPLEIVAQLKEILAPWYAL